MGLRIQALMVSAVATFCSVGALALGLGEIKLNSALNQPLDAEIQLLQVRDLTEERINVSLASKEEFGRLGVERPHFLNDLSFSVDLDAAGGPVVRITSLKPVREPFLDFVINARWPSGKLLREYTLLVDLPVFSGNRQPPAQQAAPAQASRPAPTPPPPAKRAPAPSRPEPATPAPAPAEAAAEPEAKGEYGPVSGNDTLWGIAARVRPDPSVTVQQTMLAIQRLNPNSFINNNINLIRRGQVLRVPSKEEIERLTARQAAQEVGNQNRAWSQRNNPAAAAPQLEGSKLLGKTRPEATQAQGRVKLSSGVAERDGAASGAGEGDGTSEIEGQLAQTQEQLDAATRENDELRSRIQAMEEQVETMERLVEVSSEEMRALELVAQRTNEMTEQAEQERTAANANTAEQAVGADAVRADAAEVGETAAGPAAEEASQDLEHQAALAADATPAETAPTVADTGARPAQRQQTSWVDILLENVLFIAIGLGVLVAGLLAWLFMRNRDDGFDFDDDDLSDFDVAEEDDEQSTVAFAAPDTGRLDAEEGFGQDEPDNTVVASRAEAETEDVVAESDIHIAYGQLDQAEEKLLRALEKNPADAEARLKLLEVYAAQDDIARFDDHYAKLMALDDERTTERAAHLRGGFADAGPFIPSKHDTVGTAALTAGGAGMAAASRGAPDLGVTQETRTSDLAATMDLSSHSPNSGWEASEGDDTLIEDGDPSADDEVTLFAPTDYDLDIDEDTTQVGSAASTAGGGAVGSETTVSKAIDDSDLANLEFDLDESEFDFDLDDLDSELAMSSATAAAEPEPATETVQTSALAAEDSATDSFDAGDFELDEEFASDWTDLGGAVDPTLADTAESEKLDVDFSSLDLDRTLETSAVSDEDLQIADDGETDLNSESPEYSLDDEFSSESLSATTVRPAIDFDLGADQALPQDGTSVAQPDDVGVDLAASLDELDSEKGGIEESLELDDLGSPLLDDEFDKGGDLSALDLELDDLAADTGSEAGVSDATIVEEVSEADEPFAKKAKSGWDDIEEADFTELALDDVTLDEEALQPAAASGATQPSGKAFSADAQTDYEIPDFDPESDDDTDLDFLSDTDETATKLDLARAYIDMGDSDGARDILGEVIDEGSQDQKQQAETLLARIG